MTRQPTEAHTDRSRQSRAGRRRRRDHNMRPVRQDVRTAHGGSWFRCDRCRCGAGGRHGRVHRTSTERIGRRRLQR